MRKIKTIMLIAGVISSSAAIANNVCKKNFAMMECGRGTVSSVDFTGMVEINGTTVTNSFDVLGNVEMRDANITNMHVKGMNEIKNTQINGYMNITGEVNAERTKISGTTNITGNWFGKNNYFNSVTRIVGVTNCNNCTFNDRVTFIGIAKTIDTQFNSNINIKSRESEFIRTKLQDITASKPSKNEEATIILSRHSTARNIKFEGTYGTVILKDGSRITGRVEGGKVINN